MKQTKYIIFLAVILAQVSLAQKSSDRYISWSERNPSQKAFLIFNQDKYTPGDTAYFKAYLFENQVQMVGSEVLTLSVVDHLGRQSAKVNFRVNKGITQNRIFLPDSLKPGRYRFVAYSQWMIGNPSSPAFSTELSIIARKPIALKPDEDLRAAFFSEGGHLIAGLTNKIVVEVAGQAEDTEGIVVDEAGATTGTVKLRFGRGALFLKPEANHSYKLRISGKEFSLPEVEEDGISILFNKSKNRAPVRVVFTAPDASQLRAKNLQLLLTLNGTVYLSQNLTLGDQPFFQLAIPLAGLPAGVARLAVFNGNTPIAERYFFVDYAKPVRVELNTAQTEKASALTTVRVRDKVSMEVTLSNEDGPVEGEFAVSAINAKLFSPAGNLSFADDVILPSRLDHRVDRNQPDWDEQLDQAMITLKTDPAEWAEVFASRLPTRPTGGHFHIELSATDQTGKPVPDSTIMMVFLQKDATGYASRTIKGKFDFNPLGDFKGMDELFCVAKFRNKNLDDFNVAYVDPAIDLGAAASSQEIEGTDPYADFSVSARAIRNSYSFFAGSTKLVVTEKDPNQELEDELDGADVSVELAKYIAFPNMDEVIREVIPALFHYTTRGQSHVRVDLIKTDIPAKADPLYIIDGIMTRDTDYFIGLDPVNVQTIKVVRDAEKLAQWGPVGRAGVVFVRTKVPDAAAVKSRGTFVKVQGMSWPVKNMAAATAAPLEVPDFRATMHWEPVVKTDKNGKAVVTFYASDDTGPVVIRLGGITTGGVPFSAQTTVVVDFSRDVYTDR